MTQRYGRFNNSRAQSEGWSLCSDGLIRRLSVIAVKQFDNNMEARDYVERRAAEGIAYHRRAWEIHCTTIANQRLHPP